MKEAIRFVIVGTVATGIQAVVYWLLVGHTDYAVANTIGYVVSFLFNYVATLRFTFRVKSSAKRGAGFVFSHVVNYLLQTTTLALFIRMGVGERLALLPMFAICAPINFLLIRFFFKENTQRLRFLLPRREERLPALAAMLLFVAMNALTIVKYHSLLSQPQQSYRVFFLKHFHVSGFDPLTYQVVSDWATAYNVYRHPLLAFYMYLPSVINHSLSQLVGINCVQFVVALILITAAFYSFIFLFRIFRDVMRLPQCDALLLTVLHYGFAYVLLSTMVPDHFVLSMLLLTLVLYVSGRKMQEGRLFTKWQTIVLFVLTAGVSLNNGVKVFLAALFTNGRRFFRPSYLLIAVLLPSLLMWIGARKEYQYMVYPAWKARKEAKARMQRQADERATQLFRDTVTTNDTAQIAAGVERVLAKQKADRKQQVANRVSTKHSGRPIKNGEFWNWTDATTSRTATAVHNLFGEAVILHKDHLLQDVLTRRPVIVEYRCAFNYIVEGILVLLILLGIVAGGRSRFLWLSLSFFGFDMLIHMLLGFGINEIYIMSPHWAFVYPIAIGYLLRRPDGRWRLGLRCLLLAMAVYLYAVNLSLITPYFI